MTPDEQLQSFLLKDYELKIRYLSDHFARMWVRFNFFVTVQTALSVALFGWFKEKPAAEAVPIAVVGAVSCLCWYVFGAQDRYLVALYREHVKLVGDQLCRQLADAEAKRTFIIVGDVNAPVMKPAIWQWRLEPLSTTKLVAWFPLLVALYWLILIWQIKRGW